jgi:hypothetical protein
VNEGGAVTLGATDTVLDSDDTLGNVTITGLPTDLTNVGGGGSYTAASGTWTGTAAQFNALSFTTAEQEGTFVLSISATTSGAEAGMTTGGYSLTINSVAEAPALNVPTSVAVTEGSSVTFSITDGLGEVDADASLGNVTITGMPNGVTFNTGSLSGGTLTLTQAQLGNLTMTVPEGDNFTLIASVTTTDGTSSATTTKNIGVNVAGVAEAPTLTVAPVTVSPNGTAPVSITDALSEVDPDSSLGNITITGIPTGGGSTTYWATGNNGTSLIKFDIGTGATTVVGNLTTSGTYGLAFGPDGTAYTLQGSNATLAKVNLSNGALTTIGGPGGFFGYALDFAPNGTLYAVNVGTNQIYSVNTTTGAFTFVSTLSGPATEVMDITFDQYGNMYAVGPSDNKVYSINPTTGVSTLAFTTVLSNLMGIAADGNGNLIATSYTSPSQFERINISNGTSTIVGSIGAGTSLDHGGDIQLGPCVTFNQGTLSGSTLTLTPAQLSGLTMTDNGVQSDFALTVSATASDGSNIATSTASLPVRINLLTNPGFETGTFSGWSVGGNPYTGVDGVSTAGQVIPNTDAGFGTDTVVTRSGSYAAYADVASASLNFLDLSQTLSLSAGNYSAGFYLTVNSSSYTHGYGNASEILLDGNPLSTAENEIPSTGVFSPVSASFSLSSAGVHTITFKIDGSGTAVAGVSADDFFLIDPPAGSSDPNSSASLNTNGGSLVISDQFMGGAPATINGGSLEFSAGSDASVNFAPGVAGELQLDASQEFSGTISGFAPGDSIDLADVSFGVNTILDYWLNADNSGGTLSIGDATHAANIALLGSYMASSFAMSSDGHGGTLITNPPVGPQTTIANDTTLAIVGASSQSVTFAGNAGSLLLDQSQSFTGTVAGFGGQDQIDLGDIAYSDVATTLDYWMNSDSSGGTLTVSDGSHTANLSLLGQYAASSFAMASDGHGGTLITEAAAIAQNQPMQPHA